MQKKQEDSQELYPFLQDAKKFVDGLLESTEVPIGVVDPYKVLAGLLIPTRGNRAQQEMSFNARWIYDGHKKHFDKLFLQMGIIIYYQPQLEFYIIQKYTPFTEQVLQSIKKNAKEMEVNLKKEGFGPQEQQDEGKKKNQNPHGKNAFHETAARMRAQAEAKKQAPPSSPPILPASETPPLPPPGHQKKQAGGRGHK